jgi:DNA-binding transcriptional regulator GbsR (MarR family)
MKPSNDASSAFDPEIRKIEEEIVDFFSKKGSEFIGRHPHVSMVMIYFYIRRRLTQRDLQALTGLSAGSVSKAVRQLIEMNMITKETIAGTHTHIYTMDKSPFISPRFFLATGRYIGNIEEELKEMKKTLDENKEEMKKLEGYDRIYNTITRILGLIPLTEVFMKTLEKGLV